jgi:hypothetical protein
MCDVYDLACKSYVECSFTVAAELDARGSTAMEDVDMGSSVEAVERICQEV